MRRRAWLQGGLGLGLGALCLPSVMPRGARAEPTEPVKRLLILMTEHGTVYSRWRMRPGGLSDDEDWEVPLAGLAADEFSEILRPLHDYRDRLLVLDGLGLATGQLTATSQHEEGHATSLTGTVTQMVKGAIARASGPSIDQIVAEAIAAPGQIASLQVSHGSWPYCFDAGGLAIPYIFEPGELYLRLFPDGQDGPPPQSSALARIRAKQGRVVDLVREQYTALAPRLGAEDRVKVEQHRDLLTKLSAQLDAWAKLVCAAPEEPLEGPAWEDPQWYDHRAALFTTLTALALSCDLTRVAVLAFSGLRNEHVGAPPGDIHNDFAHAVSVDPVAEAVMVNYHRYHAEDFRRLLAALDQIPSEGGTLLDDTLVVWANELGTPEHGMFQWPVVLAGGSSFFAPGRYVRWRQSNLVPGEWGDEWQGPPHNRLLVSIARAMGLHDVDRVGEASVPLGNGGALDCTGELDRLR